jgi:omega-6 fatty acid desaturase (delta-12 desaturase)
MLDSGLKGSSFLQIPWYLKYFTGGIEYHHIHHANARIPNYFLETCHNEIVSESDVFDGIVKLSLTDCCNNMSLIMYDEDAKKYISFKEADAEIKKEA